MRSVVLVALVGCGRFGFGEGNTVADAPVDVDPANFCAFSPTAPPTVNLRGFVFRYTSFDNNRTPLSDALIEAKDGPNGETYAMARSAMDGAYDLALDTSGSPLQLFVHYTWGTDLATDVHFDVPVERDITGPNADTLELGDAPIWNAGQMGSIYSTGGVTRDPTKAFISVAVRDCLGFPIAGAKIDMLPAPEAIVYQANDGRPQMGLTETQTRYGQGFGMNASGGSVLITVTHPTRTFQQFSVPYTPGTNTLVVARASN